ILKVEIIDKDRKQKVRFRYKGLGVAGQSYSAVPGAASSVMVTSGSVVGFTTTKSATLAQFAGSVDVGQSPGAGVGPLATGGDFGFSFRALEKAGPKTRPTAVTVDAGQGFGTPPSAGLGGITSGMMTMIGSPAPL